MRRYLSASRGTVRPEASNRLEEEQQVSSSEIAPSAEPTTGDVSGSTGPTPEQDSEPVTAHIAAQLAALDQLAELPLAEHAQLYQHLHAELQDALTDIDGP
jgi:hypothetical protein